MKFCRRSGSPARAHAHHHGVRPSISVIAYSVFLRRQLRQTLAIVRPECDDTQHITLYRTIVVVVGVFLYYVSAVCVIYYSVNCDMCDNFSWLRTITYLFWKWKPWQNPATLQALSTKSRTGWKPDLQAFSITPKTLLLLVALSMKFMVMYVLSLMVVSISEWSSTDDPDDP